MLSNFPQINVDLSLTAFVNYLNCDKVFRKRKLIFDSSVQQKQKIQFEGLNQSLNVNRKQTIIPSNSVSAKKFRNRNVSIAWNQNF